MSEDKLDKEIIRSYLPGLDRNILIYDELESTNLLAKEIARTEKKSGSLIVANSQTKGRGRLARSFFSPKDAGIYMSYIFIPKSSENIYDILTALAGLAVRRAVSTLYNIELGIKWVNDLYYQDKKVCGILSEGVYDLEKKQIVSAVIGIGINVNPSLFPKEIEDKAGSLASFKSNYVSRNRLIAEIVKEFELLTTEENLRKRDFLDEYRQASIVIGKRVKVSVGDNEYYAKVLDIDKDCALIVEKDDASIQVLSYGEISLSLQ